MPQDFSTLVFLRLGFSPATAIKLTAAIDAAAPNGVRADELSMAIVRYASGRANVQHRKSATSFISGEPEMSLFETPLLR